jgi:hypothetical protein
MILWSYFVVSSILILIFNFWYGFDETLIFLHKISHFLWKLKKVSNKTCISVFSHKKIGFISLLHKMKFKFFCVGINKILKSIKIHLLNMKY